MNVHVSDASRLGCGVDSIILNLPQQKRSALALKSILISALSLIDLNIELKINELCEHAGVSIGTFYVYFKNIDHLIKYLHFLHVKDCEESLTRISRDKIDPAKKILIGAESIYEIHSSNRILHRFFKEEIENKLLSNQIIHELKKSIIASSIDFSLEEKRVEDALHLVKPWVENDRTFNLGLEELKNQLSNFNN